MFTVTSKLKDDEVYLKCFISLVCIQITGGLRLEIYGNLSMGGWIRIKFNYF
jgi:hypothetical protein